MGLKCAGCGRTMTSTTDRNGNKVGVCVYCNSFSEAVKK